MKLSGLVLLFVGRYIYFSVLWVFLAVRSLPLVAVSGGYSLVAMHGVLIGVSCCRTRALGSRAQ